MRILIPHTRELCYFSGSYFLDRIQEELLARGAEVVRLGLLEEDFHQLEEALSFPFDGIIDINSRLPRLIDDEGRYFLDTIDVPFYNYILDHPLYHHPGLSVRLHDYHAIGVDMAHCAYMKRWYPHLKSVSCIPMGGTPAVSSIPFSSRMHDFLFPGTYILPEVIEERELRVRSDHGDATYQLMQELYSAWDPGRRTIEDRLHELLLEKSSVAGGDVVLYINDVYEARDEAELLNRLYIVDQKKRNELRYEMLLSAAETGYELSILGEGWEQTKLSGFSNVRLLSAVTMELSFEVMANARYLIDSNPLFSCGMHDRVASALANGCVCITDMSPGYDRRLRDGENVLYYGPGFGGVTDCMRRAMSMGHRAEEVALAGRRLWEGSFSWVAHADRLCELLAGHGG